MNNDELIITRLPTPSVATRRALRGQPLPTDDSIHVSGLRWSSEYGFHVRATSKPRPWFAATSAMCSPRQPWLDWYCTIEPGIVVLKGPDYRASAEAAKAFLEAQVYDPADDMENRWCHVLWNDKNDWWIGEG